MATNVQGSSTFRRIQIAHEGFAAGETEGTHRGVAITDGAKYHALVNGALTVTPEVEYLIPEETRASLAERHSVTPVQRQAALSFSGPADFEQIVDFLKMSIKGNVTATNSGDVDVHEFKPNINQLNDPSSYSVVYGDNVKNFASAYVMASQFSLSGTMGEAVQLSVDMFAQDLTENQAPDTTTKTSKWYYQPPYTNIQNMVSLRSEFFIAEKLEDLYKAESRADGYLRSWELTLPTGCRPYLTAEGKAGVNKLDYRLHIEDMRTGEVALSFISQNATWDNEFDAWINGKGRWVRVVVHGPAISDGTLAVTDITHTEALVAGTYNNVALASGGTVTVTVSGTGNSRTLAFSKFSGVKPGATTINRDHIGGTALTSGSDDIAVTVTGEAPANRFFEFVAYVRYDDNPELFADDDGKSLFNVTAHTYDPHAGTGVAVEETGFPAAKTITDASGAATPDLVVGDTDNFDFLVRVRSHKQESTKRT